MAAQEQRPRPLPWWFFIVTGAAVGVGALIPVFTDCPLYVSLPPFLGGVAALWAGLRRPR